MIKTSYTYFVKTANKCEKVCKKGSHLSICKSSVLPILPTKNETSSYKTSRTLTSQHSLPSILYKVIINRTNTFHLKIWYCSWKKIQYLHPNLTVRIMYCLLEIECEINFYYRVFKERFNVSFRRNQVDVCGKYKELSQKIKIKWKLYHSGIWY